MERTPTFELIKTKPWLKAPAGPASCVTMLMDEERAMLQWLAHHVYSGAGSLLDCGAFLGGSTIALAQGLKKGRAPARKVHSYDLFVAGKFEGKNYAEHGLVEGKSFRDLYDRNIAHVKDLVEVHEGDITQAVIPDGEIEILFVDCAKAPDVNDFFVTRLFPRLIPGQSIVVQQDYLFPALPWIQITMEYFSDCFEMLADTELNSVIYGCTKAIPPKAAIGCVWHLMSTSMKHLLMQQAINRWQGKQRQMVIGAYASYDFEGSTKGWRLAAA
jgi:hypothetical protein